MKPASRSMATTMLAAILALSTSALALPGTAQGTSALAPSNLQDLAVTVNATAQKLTGYLGSELSTDGVLTVSFAGSTPAVTNSLDAVAGVLPVTIKQVDRSLADLSSVRDAITNNNELLLAQGIKLKLWTPDIKNDTVDIWVADMTAGQAATITKLYGASNVTVQAAGPDQELTADSGRDSDTPAFYGGDFIANEASGHFCSLGPPVHATATGTRYMLTAGHCWPVGTTTENSWFDNADQTWHGGKNNTGTIEYNDDSDNRNNDFNIDAEIGQSDTGGYDWRGRASASTVQAGGQTVGGGVAVCTDGAYETEVCGLSTDGEVSGGCANVSLNDGKQGYLVDCSLYRAQKLDTAVVGSGDSGGPMYYVNSAGRLEIIGIVAASGNPYPCPSGPFVTNRTCSETVYYTDIISILQDFNLTLTSTN